jgi:hypothetical protein
VGELVVKATIWRVEIGSHRYAASFLFDAKGGLRAVQLRLADESSAIESAYDELAAQLLKEHGPPTGKAYEPDAFLAWARRASWATGESIVELNGWQGALPESLVLTLDLRGGSVRPMDEGSVVVTYRAVNDGR